MSFAPYWATLTAFPLANRRSFSVHIEGHHRHCSLCGMVYSSPQSYSKTFMVYPLFFTLTLGLPTAACNLLKDFHTGYGWSWPGNGHDWAHLCGYRFNLLFLYCTFPVKCCFFPWGWGVGVKRPDWDYLEMDKRCSLCIHFPQTLK